MGNDKINWRELFYKGSSARDKKGADDTSVRPGGKYSLADLDQIKEDLRDLHEKIEKMRKLLELTGIREVSTYPDIFRKFSVTAQPSFTDLVERLASLEKRNGVVWKAKSECPGGHVKRKKEFKRG